MLKRFTHYFRPLFFLVVSFFPFYYAHADIGPKPSTTIHVTYNGQLVKDVVEVTKLGCYSRERAYANAIGCEELYGEKNCKFDPTVPDNTTRIDHYTVKDLKNKCYWQGMFSTCSHLPCKFSGAYDFFGFDNSDFKVAVKLPNEKNIFVTNVISSSKRFDGVYTVDLKSDGTARIVESFSFKPDRSTPIYLALIITVIIEFLVSLAFFKRIKFTPNFVQPLILGNIVTVPVVWIFSRSSLPMFAYNLYITEVLAFFIEAAIYCLYYRKQVSIIKLILFSLIANIVSYFLGSLIYFNL